MTDIDLTPMNEATARELFAHIATENAIRKMNVPDEQQAQTRIQWRENMRRHWDEMPAHDDGRLYYRELALVATLTTWKDVARQAWSQGYRMGDLDQYSGSYPRTKNPYEEI